MTALAIGWAEAVRHVPTIAVAALAALACAGALVLPERPALRRYAFLAALLCGGAAVAATVWQQRRQWQAADRQQETYSAQGATVADTAARLKSAWQRLDAIDRLLPAAANSAPAEPPDTIDAGFAALATESDDLEKRVKAFRDQTRTRAIDDAIAAAMIDYFRQHGAHRVVVSCTLDDQEAFLYANRLATILRQAGWDATGPEATAIFGNTPATGVSLYVRGGARAPEAASVLVDAFARFNIPYQSRLAAGDAIPDTETVELFVGKKP